MRAARASITELRTVDQITLSMQSYWASIPRAVRKSTDDCRSVTLQSSLDLCAPILQLRMQTDAAAQRDKLDEQIRADETALAKAPAVSVGDPGAEAASALLNWVSGDLLSLTPSAVQKIRIATLALTPSMAGTLLALSVLLWRGRRKLV
jgi:hypothetical protein